MPTCPCCGVYCEDMIPGSCCDAVGIDICATCSSSYLIEMSFMIQVQYEWQFPVSEYDLVSLTMYDCTANCPKAAIYGSVTGNVYGDGVEAAKTSGYTICAGLNIEISFYVGYAGWSPDESNNNWEGHSNYCIWDTEFLPFGEYTKEVEGEEISAAKYVRGNYGIWCCTPFQVRGEVTFDEGLACSSSDGWDSCVSAICG